MILPGVLSEYAKGAWQHAPFHVREAKAATATRTGTSSAHRRTKIAAVISESEHVHGAPLRARLWLHNYSPQGKRTARRIHVRRHNAHLRQVDVRRTDAQGGPLGARSAMPRGCWLGAHVRYRGTAPELESSSQRDPSTRTALTAVVLQDRVASRFGADASARLRSSFGLGRVIQQARRDPCLWSGDKVAANAAASGHLTYQRQVVGLTGTSKSALELQGRFVKITRPRTV